MTINSYRLVFLTRTERPSGARVAAELARQFGTARRPFPTRLVAIVAERRAEMVKRRRGVLRAGWDAVRQHGVEFVLRRVRESVRAKTRHALHLRSDEDFACVSEVAERFGVPLHVVANHNDAACVDQLCSLQPDIITVTNARVLKGDVLRAARLGCLNLHTSKLPQYRGLESIFWALYHGETEIGVTVHFIEEGLDAGDIVLQQTLPVGANDTVEALYAKAIEVGAQLMAEAVRQVAAGTAQRAPQNEAEATSFGWPTPQQRRELAKRLRARRRQTGEN